MNTGLLDQLNTYFSDLDSDQGPVTADNVADLLENVRELPPTPVPIRSRPKIWVAMVAAAVTILVVASIPLLFRSGTEEGPPATEPVTSTTTDVDQTATTTAELPLVLPAPTVEWRTITFDGESGPLSSSPVYTADGQFIVYDSSLESDDTGAVTDLDGDLRTILWRSPDGLDWERFHLSEFDGLSTLFIGEAFGTYVVTVFDPSDSSSYTATSTDLITWTKWFDPGGETPRGWAGAITATDSAAIISGYGPMVRVDPSFADPVIIDPSAFGLDEYSVLGNGIVATATSFYVYDPAGGDSIWWSRDGLEWTEHVLSGAPVSMTDMPLVMLANNEHVLAYKIDDRRFAWIGGEDGFTLLEDPPTFSGKDIYGAATEHGFILGIGSFVGPDESGEQGDPNGIHYATTDGSQWTQIDGALSKFQNQAVGPMLLMPSGTYTFTPDADDQGGSGGQAADGAWVIGITRP